MARYFVDTEFNDTGRVIELISIGVVCECGDSYYAQALEFNLASANDWVRKNVFPHLQFCKHVDTTEKTIENILWTQMADHGFLGGGCYASNLMHLSPECPWRTRDQIRNGLLDFFNPSDSIELWGHCSGYDFVALCQLFGTMTDLPSIFPHYIRDLQQILDDRGVTDEELPQQEEGKHHALGDAKYIEKLWGYIVRGDAWQ